MYARTLRDAHATFERKVRELGSVCARELRSAAAAHADESRRLIAPNVPWPIRLLFSRQIEIVRAAQASEIDNERKLLSLAAQYESVSSHCDLLKELEQIVAQSNPELKQQIDESQESLNKLSVAVRELGGERFSASQATPVVFAGQPSEVGGRFYVAALSEPPGTRYVVPADGIPANHSLGTIRLDPSDEVSVIYLDDTLSIQLTEGPAYSPNGIERSLADTFHLIITNAVVNDCFDENHITFSIVEHLKRQEAGFQIRYQDGCAHVTVKADKLRPPREENYGDLCLIVELNYRGTLSAGVRYFEAKRRYLETKTYRAFGLEQARKIYRTTAYSSLLAFDPTMPLGWSCSDIPLQFFMTPDFKKRDVTPIVAQSGMPFSNRLVNQYFRLDESMDCSEDSVMDAARYAKQRFNLIAHVKVSIAEDPEQAYEMSMRFSQELDLLIERGPSIERTISHTRNI